MAKGKYEKWLEPDNLLRIGAWARDGLTDQQIAQNMGISRSTLNEWKTKHSDISDTLKRDKELADIMVENALFKKARGYTVKVKKHYKIKTVTYNEQGKKIKESEELVGAFDEVHIPADTTAQIYYLNNRRPDRWRNRRDEAAATKEGKEILDAFMDALEANDDE